VLFAVVINPAVEGIERLRTGKWFPRRRTATLLTFLFREYGLRVVRLPFSLYPNRA